MKSKLRTVKVLVHYLLLQVFGYAFTFTPSTSKTTSRLPMVANIISQTEPGALLKRRLIEGGIVKSSDIELRPEFNKSEEDEVESSTSCSSSSSSSSSSSTVHVKSLVWEVSFSNQNKQESFYIVTAQKMSDRVDISLLQDLIYNDEQQQQLSSKLSNISMAPTIKAESMTGFQSGCMPPIGHTIPMKLYVEESITQFDMASVGSGTLKHSLLVPMKQLLEVAGNNDQGVLVGKFVQSTTRSGSPSSVILETNKNTQTTKQETKKPDRRQASIPKDRLKEYKSLSSIAEKAQLFRTTSRKIGRVDTMKQLIDEAIKNGDFPEVMSTSKDVGVNKNALHHCSWKGDFETVKYLVEMSKRHYPQMDIINTISKSDGNHGKTPIFFALTQCREDVARYLVSEGASLLVVNNKGQTPCSIAVSHVDEEACQFLFEAEARQLRDGGVFLNYRNSHSDGKLYGDLDPRFEIDDDNMGDDVTDQIKQYKESIPNGAATIHNGIPTCLSPRSLRPTVRWWKRADKSLANANAYGVGSDEITFTQPRGKTSQKLKANTEQHPQPKKLSPIPIAPKKALDIDSLDPLTIDQVLNLNSLNGCTPADESKILVDSLESIRLLESKVDQTILHAKTLAGSGEYSLDEALLETVWGLDCEWFPGPNCGRDSPVATLQLSTQRHAFLVDLQSLCQAKHNESTIDGSTPNELEQELNRVLSKLFTESLSDVPLIGFGVLADLGKMAASFPHLPSFCHYTGIIDLQKVCAIALPKSERQNMSSLQSMVALILEKRLDKTQQCSDWTRRPLTSDQLEYATLDAAVLPFLLKQIMGQSIAERYNGQLFNEHPHLLSNIRFTFLPEENDPSNCEEGQWYVPMGKNTTMFSKQLARQCWPTSQAIPDLPTKRMLPAEPKLTKKERAHIRKVGTGGKRPKPVQLRDIMAKLNDLPTPGTTIGYTKDSCVHLVVGHEFINALPERTHIGFNRRSGVSETRNTWIIFANFGGTKKSNSGFLKDGKEFRFNLNPKNAQGKSSEKSLFDFISSRHEPGFSESIESDDRTILLFARCSTRHKYTYCGTCESQGLSPTEFGSIDLLLNLVNYSELVGENKSEDFLELVQIGCADSKA